MSPGRISNLVAMRDGATIGIDGRVMTKAARYLFSAPLT